MIDITIESNSPAHRIAALQSAWLARCPLLLALSTPTDIVVTFNSPATRRSEGHTMTTTTTEAIDADRALKARHRAMWALGDYPDLTPELFETGRRRR